MFPCYFCGNPRLQVQSLIQFLKKERFEARLQNKRASGFVVSVRYGVLWIDIEGPGQYWSNTTSDNVKFIQQLVDEAENQGTFNKNRSLYVHSFTLAQVIGIYTSARVWPMITNDWHGLSDKPLWYPRYVRSEHNNWRMLMVNHSIRTTRKTLTISFLLAGGVRPPSNNTLAMPPGAMLMLIWIGDRDDWERREHAKTDTNKEGRCRTAFDHHNPFRLTECSNVHESLRLCFFFMTIHSLLLPCGQIQNNWKEFWDLRATFVFVHLYLCYRLSV